MKMAPEVGLERLDVPKTAQHYCFFRAFVNHTDSRECPRDAQWDQSGTKPYPNISFNCADLFSIFVQLFKNDSSVFSVFHNTQAVLYAVLIGEMLNHFFTRDNLNAML